MGTFEKLCAHLALVFLHLLAPSRAPAAEADPLGSTPGPSARDPFLVLSLASYDTLRQNIGYLFECAGESASLQAFDAAVAMVSGGQGGEGIGGIDTARPMGLVLAGFEPAPRPLLFLPVKSEAGVLRLIAAGFPVQELLAPGIYKISGNMELHVKFSGGWVFAAEERSHLERSLPDPRVLLADQGRHYDIRVALKVGALPPALKESFSENLIASAARDMSRRPGEDANHHAGRIAGQEIALRMVSEGTERFLADAKEATLSFRISRADRKATGDLTVSAYRQTELASSIKSLEGVSNRFAGITERKASLSIMAAVPLGESMKQVLSTLSYKVRSGANADPALRNSPERKLVERLLAVLEANADEARLEGAVSFKVDPEGRSLLLGAGRLVRAQDLEAILVEVPKLVPASRNDFDVKPNTGRHADMSLHTVRFKDPPAQVRRLFGPDPTLHLAFGKDAVYFAAGSRGQAELTAAIDAHLAAGSGGQKTPLFALEMSLGDWARLEAAQTRQKDITPMILECLARDDRLRISVEALPGMIQLHGEVEEGILRAISKSVALGMPGLRKR